MLAQVGLDCAWAEKQGGRGLFVGGAVDDLTCDACLGGGEL